LSATPKSGKPTADVDARGAKGRIWLKIGLFYVLVMLLTFPLELLMHRAQGNGSRVMVVALMWSPAVAAVLITLLYRDNIRSLGWRWGSWRYIRWALIIPVLYVLPAYLAVWVLGLGGFYDADFAATVTHDYGFAGAPAVWGLIGYLLLILTAGLVISVSRARGGNWLARLSGAPTREGNQLYRCGADQRHHVVSLALSGRADGHLQLRRHPGVVWADLLFGDGDIARVHRRLVTVALGEHLAVGDTARRA
jgi:hypothetical protein